QLTKSPPDRWAVPDAYRTSAILRHIGETSRAPWRPRYTLGIAMSSKTQAGWRVASVSSIRCSFSAARCLSTSASSSLLTMAPPLAPSAARSTHVYRGNPLPASDGTGDVRPTVVAPPSAADRGRSHAHYLRGAASPPASSEEVAFAPRRGTPGGARRRQAASPRLPWRARWPCPPSRRRTGLGLTRAPAAAT